MAENTVQTENQNAGSTPAQQTVNQNTGAKAEDIAAAFMAALDARTQRAERSVAKSFGEQYGMTDAEINAILTKAKAEKAAKIPDDVQANIDARMKAVNDRLKIAELKAIGTTMGLVDADTALKLIPDGDIGVDDDGKVTGVKEALEKLKAEKPYFFGAQPTGNKANVGVNLQNNTEHTYTVAELKNMSRDEIQKHLKDIFKQKELK